MERQAALETLSQLLEQIERDSELTKQQQHLQSGTHGFSNHSNHQQITQNVPTGEQEELLLLEPQLSTQTLHVLASLLPTVLAASLQILDQGKVTKFVGKQSQRHFYRVKESKKQSVGSEYSAKGISERTASGAVYFDVLSDHCFCYFVAKQTLTEQGSSLLCKHVVAAKLAQAFSKAYPHKLMVKEIDDIDFQPLFLSSRNHLTKFDEKKMM